jgi:hypothetical protein
MATGGHHSFKTAGTDPRPRASWQRTTSVSDKEDNISNHSIPLEHRQNNWVNQTSCYVSHLLEIFEATLSCEILENISSHHHQ